MKSAFSVLCPKVSLLISYTNVNARTPAKSQHVLPGLIVNEHDSAGPPLRGSSPYGRHGHLCPQPARWACDRLPGERAPAGVKTSGGGSCVCSCTSLEGRVPCRGRAWETTLPACPVQGVARTTPGVGVCGGIVCAARMGVNF